MEDGEKVESKAKSQWLILEQFNDEQLWKSLIITGTLRSKRVPNQHLFDALSEVKDFFLREVIEQIAAEMVSLVSP